MHGFLQMQPSLYLARGPEQDLTDHHHAFKGAMAALVIWFQWVPGEQGHIYDQNLSYLHYPVQKAEFFP